MTDSTMTEIPLVERLRKISDGAMDAIAEHHVAPMSLADANALAEAAAMLKAAVEALEEIEKVRLGGMETEANIIARDTLASLKQPSRSKP